MAAMTRRGEARRHVTEYKKSHPCELCGFKDYRALDFHHSPPESKTETIGRLVGIGSSIARIDEEIAKCISLCRNCHAVVEWEIRASKKGRVRMT